MKKAMMSVSLWCKRLFMYTRLRDTFQLITQDDKRSLLISSLKPNPTQRNAINFITQNEHFLVSGKQEAVQVRTREECFDNVLEQNKSLFNYWQNYIKLTDETRVITVTREGYLLTERHGDGSSNLYVVLIDRPMTDCKLEVKYVYEGYKQSLINTCKYLTFLYLYLGILCFLTFTRIEQIEIKIQQLKENVKVMQ